METGELVCEKRETRPKRLAVKLRRQGRVPGVLYGPKTTPTPVVLNAADVTTRVAHAASMRLMRIKSSSPELDGKHVILKEIQRAPVSRAILHADLYEVDLNRPIRVKVPLRFSGRAVGVALGGILQPLEREVEVECLPLEIPEFVETDVSALGIHDVIHVSAIPFTGNVKPIFDTDYPVVTVLPPTVAEAPTPAVEAAPAEEAAAPAEGAPAAEPAPGAKEGAAGAPAAAATGAKKGEAGPKK
jgi:large subunit ribosomal protein L25